MRPEPSRLTYIGHATLLIELGGVRVLTDPLLSAGILHVRRRVPPPAIEELRPLDAILISHTHRDHLDPPSLRAFAGECPVIVPRGCAATARRCGALQVIELDEDERFRVGDLVVKAVHAEHGVRRHPIGRSIGALGYVLEGAALHVYFAGDTDLFAGMSALAGQVDVAALPIWGWGPRLGAGHLDPTRAAEAVARIQPRIAVPIHWGTLRAWGAQRRLDPLAPAQAFARRVERVAPGSAVRILLPGQRMALSKPPRQPRSRV